MLHYVLRLFRLLTVVGLTSISIAAQSIAPTEVELLFRQELQEASKGWDVSAIAIFSEGTHIDITKPGEIVVGRQFLDQLDKKLQEPLRSNVLRFVIAHELWHAKQFALYGTAISVAEQDLKKIYECQADVMAAAYVTGRMLKDAQQATNINKAMLTGADTLKDMAAAVSVYAPVDEAAHGHLTQYQRWTAFRFGNWRALHLYLQHIVVGDAETVALRQMARLANLEHQPDDAEWALLQCKKITHYNAAVLRYLEEDVDAPIFKDDALKTPGLGVHREFIWGFKNTSNRTIRLSVTVHSGFYPKDSEGDYSTYKYFEGFSAQTDIPSGQRGEIKGEIRYTSGGRTFVPFIWHWRFHKEALIAAEYVEPHTIRPQTDLIATPHSRTSSVSCNDGIRAITDADELKFVAGVIRIAGSANKRFSDIPKRLDFDVDGNIFHTITLGIPGSNKSSVVISQDGSAFATVQVYEGLALQTARQAYERLIGTLRRLCGAANVPVTAAPPNRDGMPSTDLFSMTSRSFAFASISSRRPSDLKVREQHPYIYTVNLFLRPSAVE